MADESNRPIMLTEFPSEALAAMFIARLGEHDIEAMMAGGATAGFRTEAPGMVRVLVHEADAERAKALLEEFRAEGK